MEAANARFSLQRLSFGAAQQLQTHGVTLQASDIACVTEKPAPP
jgi:hypothetical protein